MSRRVCPYCGTADNDPTTLADHGCCRACLEDWQWGRLCLICAKRGGEHEDDCPLVADAKALAELAEA